MYAPIAPINPMDHFSTSFEQENIFSSKATRILSTLAWGVRCKIPLDEALLSLQKKDDHKNPLLLTLQVVFLEFFILRLLKERWNTKIARTAEEIKVGTPIFLALKNNLKGCFPHYVLNALEEAEKKERLVTMLPLLAKQMRYSAGVLKERAASFSYPFIQFFLCLLVASWSFVFIVPKFKKIWEEMLEGEKLPFITNLVLLISDYLGPLFWGILLFFPSFGIFIFFYKFQPTARFCADLILFRIPFIGKDFKRMAILEFAGCMASYTALGMDITTAAKLSQESIRSYWLKKRVIIFTEKTYAGMKWIDAWDQMELGFPFYNWIARNAASREEVSEGFMQMMKWLKDDISQYSIYFIKVIQVFGLLFNAVFVGLIVIALASPLFNIARVLVKRFY